MPYKPAHLIIKKITGGISISPLSTTSGDDLTILPNQADTKPLIYLNGTSYISLTCAAASYIGFNDFTAGNFLKLSYATPDAIIEGVIDTKNLYLKTTGTGLLKFGTYTAGAATDSTGYITILDAAGNTRKLMVQA